MRVCWKNFTGGEVARSVQSRYDLDKYATSVATMENMVPGLHGDVQRRMGTRFVGELDAKSVLIPFCFSTEVGQNFVLIFSAGKLRVADEQELKDVSIDTPYADEDLYELSYAQSGDVVYLAHRKYPLHKVKRTGSAESGYEWSLEEVALNATLQPPAKPTVAFERNNSQDSAALGYTLRYKITAVDEDGNDSLPSPAGEGNGKHPSDFVAGNRVRVRWTAVDGAREYNVYREEAGYYGLIGVVQNNEAIGRTLSGLYMGKLECDISHYGGAITRTRVVGRGHVPDRDTTTGLTVAANNSRNSYIINGHILVWTVKTTNTTTWYYDSGDSDGYGAGWDYNTTTTTESFWALVPITDSANPAGTYTTFTQGDSEVGFDSNAPEGNIGPYTVVPRYSGGGTLEFLDVNFEADTSDTPKEDWAPFANGNNPATVAFHQQRLVLAGTKSEPSVFYMSKTGQYEGFRKSRPLQDDDPIEFMIASGSIDQIVWAVSFGDLLLGTSGAEYKVTADGEAITPKSVGISTQSFWGSAKLAPLIIGNSVLHSQRFGGRVRDLYYSLEKDGYQGNDLSIMAPHLFEDHTILQWCYQQTPGSNVWCIRDDGVMLCLTYLKEHNIYGWSQHRTRGKFLSVCTINGASADVVMCVVERMIEGQRRYFLERMADQWFDGYDIRDAFFVDCGMTISLPAPSREITGLSHLEGQDVDILADGSPVDALTVANGSVTLPYDASIVQIGLPYTSILGMLPMEADIQTGSTLGKQRGYGKAVVRFLSSVGGKYGAEKGSMFDIPYLPEKWGEACVPYTGDIELIVPGGQASNSSLTLVQDRPLPFHLSAVAIDVDFGEI